MSFNLTVGIDKTRIVPIISGTRKTLSSVLVYSFFGKTSKTVPSLVNEKFDLGKLKFGFRMFSQDDFN